MKKEKTIFDEMTKAEKNVADYLYSINLHWKFEHPLFVLDDKERPRVWTPDFYLPELGIYIEVCGSKDFDYEYRKKIYIKNRVQVIFIHQFKEEDNWKEFLRVRIVEINKFRSDKVMDSLMRQK